MRSSLIARGLLGPILLVGCNGRPLVPAGGSRQFVAIVAPGVSYVEVPAGSALSQTSDASVLDVDLRQVSVEVASESRDVVKGRLYGESYTVLDWCRRTDALGGVNGGFFGTTDGSKKEVIGLLAAGGEVRGSGRIVRSPSNPDRRFVRCVFGIMPDGTPRIGWSVGQRGRAALLTEYDTPLNPVAQTYWTASAAVACGPRLIRGGKLSVTDRDERLVSPPPLRRTFVGYDVVDGRPRHLALGIGMSMTFHDAAAFLQRYFHEKHGTACAEAMCLDGGSSTQMAYRIPTGFASVPPTGVTVPTAILVRLRTVASAGPTNSWQESR
jgi:hypothetical protein